MIKTSEILIYGDPRLRQTAEEVSDPSAYGGLIERMRRVMHDHNGVGLAATQLGEMVRVIVWSREDQAGALVNPELVLGDEEEVLQEGCLSVPGMAGDVRRALRVDVQGYDQAGQRVSFRAHGIIARILQHEVDHLNGVLFLDKCEPGTLRPAPATQVPGI